MPITLPKDTEARLVNSVKQYLAQELEADVGDLKASFFLAYILQEIGPVIYNQAVADVQAHLHEKITDLDTAVFEPEIGYWKR